MATEQAATTRRRDGEERGRGPTDGDPRRRSLVGLPVAERRLELAGVSTAVLEGGEGPEIVALHGPGANATHWAWVIPDLVRTNRVIAPDLPGQGESELDRGTPTAERVREWLAELIERTCATPPVLVGNAVGGAIAARFAIDRPDQISRLVLVDALGLRAFEPAPEFGQALNGFVAEPSAETHESLWRQCALDLDRLRHRMGERWEPFETYNLDRARNPTVGAALGALMGEFGLPAMPPEDLARIGVPTTLIWGRHDLATPLEVAEAASARYGWALAVIEDCADDPPVEQPEAFIDALRSALNGKDAA